MPFSELLREAWRASLSHPFFFVWGGFVALSFLGNRLFIEMTGLSFALGDSTPPTEEIDFLFPLVSSLLLIYLFFFLIRLFGKTGLILSLQSKQKKSGRKNISLTFLRKNFFRALLLEAVVFAFTVSVTLVLLIPLIVASWHNPGVMRPLFIFSLTALVPIYIIIIFIREYSLFYLLLSGLPLRQSLETGSSLFSRFTYRSLLFGCYALLTLVVFTFFLNLAMLSNVVLLEKAGLIPLAKPASFFVGFMLFTWFAVFYQALWYFFFIDLAAPKQPEVPEKESIIVKDNLPELPPA